MEPTVAVRLIFCLLKIIEHAEDLRSNGFFAFIESINGPDSAQEIIERCQLASFGNKQNNQVENVINEYLKENTETSWSLGLLCKKIDQGLPLSEHDVAWLSNAYQEKYSISEIKRFIEILEQHENDIKSSLAETSQKDAQLSLAFPEAQSRKKEDGIKPALTTLLRNLPENQTNNGCIILKYNPDTTVESLIFSLAKRTDLPPSAYRDKLQQRIGDVQLQEITDIINFCKDKDTIIKIAETLRSQINKSSPESG